MSDRVRNADLASVLGRPAEDPISALEAFAPVRELQSFQLASTAGVQAGDSLLGPAVTGASGTAVDSSFVGGTVPPTWVAVQSTLDVANDTAGTASLRLTATVANDAFGVRYGWDPSNLYPTLVCNPGDPIYVNFQGSVGNSTNDLTVHVEVAFIDSSLNVGNITYIESDLLTRAKSTDGVVSYTAYVRAPATAAFFSILISIGYSALNSTIGDKFLINTPSIVVGSTDTGPILTSPAGPRQEMVEAHTRLWTAHANETTAAEVQALIVPGTARAKDKPELLLQSSTHTASPASIKLIGAPSDASAVPAVSLTGVLESIGGFNADTLAFYAAALTGTSPLLTSVTTATWGTVTLVTPNPLVKVSVLAAWTGLLSLATLTATSEQVLAFFLDISTDGGGTFTTFQSGASITGNTQERTAGAIVGAVTSVTPTGSIQVRVRIQWAATRTIGTGGVSNINATQGNVIAAIVAVA